MKTLREIFQTVPRLCDKWDPYFDVYETYFSRFRGQSPRILEIGIGEGGSGQMWEEYFGPGTKQVAVDISEVCRQVETENIKVEIGDQGDFGFWMQFFEKHTEPFDIVIDDGSHVMPHMITSFYAINPFVKDGGIYLIEDTHTAYWTDRSIYGPNQVEACGIYNQWSVMEFSKKGIDVLNREHMEAYPQVPQVAQRLKEIFSRVKAIHYYNSMIVFEIGQQKPFVRVKNGGSFMNR